jgi:hypothetical protein
VFMVIGSLLSSPPSSETLDRYFPRRGQVVQGGVLRRQTATPAR